MMRTRCRSVAQTVAASLLLAGIASAGELRSGAADEAAPAGGTRTSPSVSARYASPAVVDPAFVRVERKAPRTSLGPGVLYDNGSVVNFPGAGPGGADDSRLQDTTLQNNIFGFGHAISTGFRMADDFTVPAGQVWEIDTITFFGYQTGSTTTSTINDVRVQIWDGPPGGGGTVVFGDLVTNRLATSTWSNAYRTLESAPGATNRPIMEVVATIATTLGEGTYWVDWQEGGTLASGPWAPPISIAGQAATGDALQFNPTPAPGAWAPAIDSGASAAPQGMPFVIEGTAGANEICVTPALAIPDNNPTGVTSTITVADTGTVTDVDVKLDVTHSWVGDVIFQLTHVDSGTSVTFYDRPGVPTTTFGCSGDNIPGVFGDDEGTDGSFESNCLNATPAFPPDGRFTGNNPLSALDGLALAGDWTLTASDAAGGDTGTLNEWCLVIESDPTPPTEPDIAVDPTSIEETLDPNEQVDVDLDITNNGDADLNWTIDEAEPLDVVLTLGEPAGLSPQGTVTLEVDDGTAENSIGLTNGGQFIWLNRFTPAAYPITLNEVSVLFASGNGINIGELVDIYVYEDADGNPGNGATFVGSQLNAAVQALDSFSVYPLDTPIDLSGPGDVLIAVVNRTAGTAAGTFVAAIDQTATQGRSWVGIYSAGNPSNPPVLPADALFGTIDSVGFPGNWLVRGAGVLGGCAAPGDVPWLALDTTAGTTLPAATDTVTVSLDSTDLAAGDYEALLCVASNDPDTPLLPVPVTLHVADNMPFLADFEEGDLSEWSSSQP